jgi:hypothetical protein
MSELVSSFLDVQLGKQKYLFFLITWTDYVTKLSKALDEQWQAFGADLGPRGSVIRAYQQHAKNSFEEVMAKPWPKEIGKRFDNEQDPFILVIDRDFAVFKPGEHPWTIIWMSDFYSEPERIYRLFGSLAKRVEHGENIFEYVQSLAQKQKVKKAGKYFELKPGIFGASVDIKAMLEDLAGADQYD